MKFLSPLALSGLLIVMMTATSCGKEEQDEPNHTNPLEDYQLVAEQSLNVNGYQLELYSKEALFVGYNQLAFRLFEAGEPQVVNNASLEILPMMDMGMMMHGAPFENPQYQSESMAYTGSTTFMMPSNAMASWHLTVAIQLANGQRDTAMFALNVIEATPARLHSFVHPQDSSKAYFVALREPRDPEIGLNDLELMIYERHHMMHFPPVSDLQLKVTPFMPSMGHGSPNNQDPVDLGNGLYAGQVNFTMSGNWDLQLEIRDEQGQMLRSDMIFQVVLQ